jgi:hypothetical protein
MATRFAISAGNYSNPAIWDNGVVPTSADDVYANGFAIAVDTNITAVSLRTIVPNVRLSAMNIPVMTGNTLPSGVCFATANLSTAYYCFDQNINTLWATGSIVLPYISYNFTSGKTIKRYYWESDSTNRSPASWTFDGSLDGSGWTTIETVTGNAAASYTSGATVLANAISYTYYRINFLSHIVPSNGSNFSRFEMTESTSVNYGTALAGSFDVSVARNITLSGVGCLYSANSATGTINITATTGTVNITASSGVLTNTLSGGQNQKNINIASTATVNIVGDIQASLAYGIFTTGTANGTYYYTGNVTQAGAGGGSAYMIYIATVCIFNITGNVYAHSNASGTTGQITVGVLASATVNITGNITAYLNYALQSSGASAGVNVIGIITGSNTHPALISVVTNGTVFTVSTPIINTNYVQAVQVNKLRLNNAYSSQWVMQDQSNATRTLYNGTGTLGMPITTNVRFGTVYGQSNEYTGALRVPNPNTVALGVLTDNTTGTMLMTPSDFWNTLSSTLTTVGSIGERLKTASTVQTTGDQIASYQV